MYIKNLLDNGFHFIFYLQKFSILAHEIHQKYSIKFGAIIY